MKILMLLNIILQLFIHPYFSVKPKEGKIFHVNDNYLIYLSYDNYRLYARDIYTNNNICIGNYNLPNLYNPILYYNDNVIFYDLDTWSIVSFDLNLKVVSWITSVKYNNFGLSGFIQPALYNDHIYIKDDSSIIMINAKNGNITYPINSTEKVFNNIRGVCSTINKYLIVNTGIIVYVYDVDTHKEIYSIGLINGKEGSAPENRIINSVFLDNTHLYIQYNAVSGFGFKNSFLAEIDLINKRIVDIYQNQYSSGIWLETKYAFIFPKVDKLIIKFNLENKTNTKIDTPDFLTPLGIYEKHIYYCSQDSVVKRDFEGKLIKNIKLGKITNNNCKLFDDKIYFIDGDNLKIIQLYPELKPNIPINIIEYILRLIIRRVIRQP